MSTNHHKQTSHTPVPKYDLTIHRPGPVVVYKLPPDELEKYRSLPPPKSYARISTTARQYLISQR